MSTGPWSNPDDSLELLPDLSRLLNPKPFPCKKMENLAWRGGGRDRGSPHLVVVVVSSHSTRLMVFANLI
jgi:hypothetical protein